MELIHQRRDELIAADNSVEEISEKLKQITLTFISTEGMLEAIGNHDNGETRGHCLACFTGNYPTEIYEDIHMSKEEIKKAEELVKE